MLDRRQLIKAGALGGVSAWLGARAHGEAPAKDAGERVGGVVFLVSDGMSTGVLPMAEQFSELVRSRGTHWWRLFSRPDAVHGLMDTASVTGAVTDSAAASTAWGSGTRTLNGRVNVDPDGRRLESIAEVLGRAGGLSGLVTTATLTHATPAGFAATAIDRDDEAAIAPQYLDRVEVLLGGGRSFFSDGLLDRYRQSGYRVVSDREGLAGARDSRVLGLFSPGHMPHWVDHRADSGRVARLPSLAEMTGAALDRLLAAGRPFLLQVEGARIDHAAHANDAAGLLWDQLAFDDALGVVLDRAVRQRDLLVVVTSDHGNANPGLNGVGEAYKRSDEAFRRASGLACSHEALFSELEGRRATRDAAAIRRLVAERLSVRLRPDEAEALCAALGGGAVVEWNKQLAKPAGLLGQFVGNHTGIGWTGTTHTADPTVVTAVGPQASRFSGLVRNDEVFGHLVGSLGV